MVYSENCFVLEATGSAAHGLPDKAGIVTFSTFYALQFIFYNFKQTI